MTLRGCLDARGTESFELVFVADEFDRLMDEIKVDACLMSRPHIASRDLEANRQPAR
jgi:hypothetical protein